MGTSPKVKAAGLAALLASVIVTYVVGVAPGLSGLSQPLQSLIEGAVTAGSAWAAGWLTRAEAWAERYVSSHNAKHRTFEGQ